MKYKSRGFTIVELLIVIVVIAILAAVSIVAYNGVQQRARASAASSAIASAKKQLEAYKLTDGNGSYPLSNNQSTAGVNDNDTKYQYTSDGTTYCITATSGNVSYKATNTSSPESGGCAGHGQNGNPAIANLTPNPSLESNITGWVAPGNSGPALARVTTQSQSGSASLRVTYNGSGYNTDGNQQQFRIPAPGFTVGQRYTVSAYVMPNAGKRMRLYVNNSANGGYLGEAFSSTSATWQRLQVSFTSNDTTQNITFHPVEGTQNSGLTNTITDYSANPYVGYVDAVMASPTNTLYNYADGNSANWIWNGTANNSSSTGPAL